jgi:hypothetical protein
LKNCRDGDEQKSLTQSNSVLLLFLLFQMESEIISYLTSMGGNSTSAGLTQTSMPVSNIYDQMYILGFV